MDSKETDFFDSLESEDNVNEIQEKVIKSITNLAVTGEHRGCFEQSVSVEAYNKRGFIKDGDLIAKPKYLFFDDWTSDYANPVETKFGVLTTYEEGDYGIYITTTEVIPGADEIEKQILKVITNNPNNFNTKKVTIYAFAPFKDSALKCILVGDYYEFKGCFEFVNTMRGWILQRYNRSTCLPFRQHE